MTTVRIVTDSACDLPAEQAEAHGVTVVPLTIRFGTDEFVDRSELSTEAFYALMAERDELPQTAAPAPGAFAASFEQLLADGADEIVSINLSSGLSATMQSAQTAAADFGDRVHVVDSQSITGGLGAMVLTAAQQAAAGASGAEIVALVEDLRARTHVYGTVDTLENLKKGGRIGNAQALVGTVLSIKPLLDVSSGEVEEAGRQRTRKKAMGWLVDKIRAEDAVESVHIVHGDAPDIDDFLALLAPHVDMATVQVHLIGPVIGSHGGPRVLGVCYRTI